MSRNTFSTSELSYTSLPLSSSSTSTLRSDGRPPLAYRDIVLTTNISRAQGALGSAQASVVDLGGESQVLAAVRGEMGEAQVGKEDDDNTPGRGNVVISIECAPPALPTLRPDVLPHLASLLTTLFSSSSLPPSLLSQLVVIPRSKAWTLHLDILILSSLGGNIIDLSLIAARCALASTRLPRTRPISYEAETVLGDESSKSHVDVGFAGLVKGGKAGIKAMDFELIDGGMEEGERLTDWELLPIGLTMNLINQVPFLDSTPLEEAASQAALVTCFTWNGDLCAMKQIGEGEIEVGRVIPLIKKAQSLAEDLRQALNQKLLDA